LAPSFVDHRHGTRVGLRPLECGAGRIDQMQVGKAVVVELVAGAQRIGRLASS
jgi:hypothetical protein